jgi:hypothetical protein
LVDPAIALYLVFGPAIRTQEVIKMFESDKAASNFLPMKLDNFCTREFAKALILPVLTKTQDSGPLVSATVQPTGMRAASKKSKKK